MSATESKAHGYSATKDGLLNRLRRIEGQVRGVERMVGDDRYCIDVITQISAIQAALDKVALGLLDDHAAHCVIGGHADAPPEELGAAVAAVAQGLVVLPKAMAEGALAGVSAAEELSEPPTAREGEVLGLLARGLSNKQIARELHISEHTVKFHISALYAKLGVGNRAEAVSQGARHGLISL